MREQCNLVLPEYVFQKTSEKELFIRKVKISVFFLSLYFDDKLFCISVIKIAYGGHTAA